ncbi:nitrate- and nitrite sensing domain-containing protein [Streptomyces sp.]|uniref:nitrate- and nitrite sensing domain-containing protein n=1 Tax=Streptomyces sp. TaxID=1931 RepID=UPI002D7900FB|nr:nitrate- and nitrite sensing domain-containing protein [Streptomyces sp.]HET6358118.1 nitrate- and nitrite sensing domain-containing protein [Streptomyces sp.]
MQNKRPSRTQDPSPEPAERGRAKRVRNRLVAGVAAVTVVVVAAGTPGILATSAELTESQRLVTLAGLDRQAVTLAHSLADERDEVTAYIAAGRADQKGDKAARRAVSAGLSARVDRQIDEIRGSIPDDHADLGRDLSVVPSVRRTALTGKGTAMEAHRAYTAVIASLHDLADELAEKTPPRAAHGTRAPAELALAVEQASATRGLLLAALALPAKQSSPDFDPITGLPVEGEDDDAADPARNALSAAAQQSRMRELAALADFDRAAGKDARDSLAATVTGAEVKTAEIYLARLTDQPELSKADRKSNREKLETSLTARIEQMRGVESTLAAERIERFEQLRDDDVTALEIRVALLGGLVIVAIGVSAAVARTLTRPLAVLRIGAARLAAGPEVEEPVRFTGRNDEFAQVVRSLNTLHGKVRDLGVRAERLDSDRGDLAGARDTLAAELATGRAELKEQTELLTAELERLRHTVQHTFVNLSLRTLGLVERQLGVIEKLEEREQDPERLATLFKLDHMATVMRRHSENLLVLAGAEHSHGHPGPVPLVDVLRAAVSEIERYERVVIQSLPPHAQVAGFAADDLSHLVAELLENATSFSPPDAQVELSGWLLESGEVMLSVQDSGIGMTAGRIAELNARLDDPQAHQTRTGRDGEGLGLRVAALLAARHGVRVQLREQKGGGIAAVVVLSQGLLPAGPPAPASPTVTMAGSAPTLQLPGSVAEANSNALPGSSRRVDPLVAAAEQAIREAEPDSHERTADGDKADGVERADGYDEADSIDEATFAMRLPELEPESDPQSEPEAEPQPEAAPEPAGMEPAGMEPEPAHPARERVTDKGLPKRTPKIVKPAAAPTGRAGGIDADALRRRLGGFQQGADSGRRDAEAEITRQTEGTPATGARTTTEEAGDTVEEARS